MNKKQTLIAFCFLFCSSLHNFIEVHKGAPSGDKKKSFNSSGNPHTPWAQHACRSCFLLWSLDRWSLATPKEDSVKVHFMNKTCSIYVQNNQSVVAEGHRPMLEWTRWKKAYPGSCIYGDWPLCVVKKWKGQICMKITSFTIGPICSPSNRSVEAWTELHATDQWAFSLCKTKRAEHARSQTENERFGWWPVCAKRGWNTRRKNSWRQWVNRIAQA